MLERIPKHVVSVVKFLHFVVQNLLKPNRLINLLKPFHITVVFENLEKTHTKGKLTLKDLLKSLASILMFSYTRLFILEEKKSLTVVNSLFKLMMSLFILFGPVNSWTKAL